MAFVFPFLSCQERLRLEAELEAREAQSANPDTLRQRGNTALSKGDADGAVDLYTRALEALREAGGVFARKCLFAHPLNIGLVTPPGLCRRTPPRCRLRCRSNVVRQQGAGAASPAVLGARAERLQSCFATAAWESEGVAPPRAGAPSPAALHRCRPCVQSWTARAGHCG